MGWVIQSDAKISKIGRELKLGRKLFPADELLSRDHAKLEVIKGQLFLTDLNSSNGTFVRGLKLTPNAKLQVFSGEKVQIGRTEFFVAEHMTRSPATNFCRASALVFLILSFADPSLDFGRSISLVQLGFLIASFAIAVIGSTFLWSWILKEGLTWKRGFLFFVLFFSSSFTINSLLFMVASEEWNLHNKMVRSKIEYFCLEKFRQNKCVNQINHCPDCALKLDKWKRDKIASKLKEFRSQYPAEQRLPSSK
jgi:hypothetical protein